jgi:hypothetical protein
VVALAEATTEMAATVAVTSAIVLNIFICMEILGFAVKSISRNIVITVNRN